MLPTSTPIANDQELIHLMLRDLGIAANLGSHQMLCLAIPRFSEDIHQGLTKELYPYLAEQCGGTNPEAVERSIRYAISEGWKNRNPAIWELYFPGFTRAPSNKQFIATLAALLKQKRTPPVSRRGKIVRRRRRRVYYLCPKFIINYPK